MAIDSEENHEAPAVEEEEGEIEIRLRVRGDLYKRLINGVEFTDDDLDEIERGINAVVDKATRRQTTKGFAGYENWDACIADQTNKGKSQEAAEKICGKLQAQAEGN